MFHAGLSHPIFRKNFFFFLCSILKVKLTWQGEKRKGIIGDLNHLASKGMSCVYALTLNIEGDRRDV
ncbi:MAG: hypothetical protein ACI9DJ_000169 [Algoriphagus sp.]|jgi:hypothetical protein